MFGANPSRQKILLRPEVKTFFNKLVYDPADYLINGFSQNNHCVPGSILLCLYAKLKTGRLRYCTRQRFAEEMHTINTKDLFCFGKQGLLLSDLPKLESLNTPIPNALRLLFPQLAYFSGFALNVFQIKSTDGHFGIFPISLSPHVRNHDRFQIDLLQLTPALIPNEDTLPNNHVLVIPFMNTLVARCSTKLSNKSKYHSLCRSCITLHRNPQILIQHEETCPKDARRGCSQPRKRSRNVLIHRPTILNKYTNKIETNGLYWKRSDNSKLIKPLAEIYSDLEAFSAPPPLSSDDMFEKVPSRAVLKQDIMSYCYTFKCIYPEIELPAALKAPRLCFTSHNDSGKELFISYFLNLRNDLVRLASWIRDLLSNDRPPPPPNQRSTQMRMYFNNVTHCQVIVWYQESLA